MMYKTDLEEGVEAEERGTRAETLQTLKPAVSSPASLGDLNCA
jgi:hypothetical protein